MKPSPEPRVERPLPGDAAPRLVGDAARPAGPAETPGAGPAGPQTAGGPLVLREGHSGPLVITVHGKPAPQGSKRHLGRGVLVEQSKRVAPWREAVKEAAIRALQAASLERYGGTGQTALLRLNGPVLVRVTFVFDKPKSAPKRRRTWPITRSSGDIDKLLRATFDALADAGAFRDDSQVIEVWARKQFTDEPDVPLGVPGAVIRVWEVAR